MHLVTFLTKLLHCMNPPVSCHFVWLLQTCVEISPDKKTLWLTTLKNYPKQNLKCSNAIITVILSSSCSLSLINSKSACSRCNKYFHSILFILYSSVWSSGIPDESVIASKDIRRHPWDRKIRKAASKKVSYQW